MHDNKRLDKIVPRSQWSLRTLRVRCLREQGTSHRLWGTSSVRGGDSCRAHISACPRVTSAPRRVCRYLTASLSGSGNMGGNGSRRVSFGLDEDEKVTVIEGVKLSEDVLRWMKQSQGSDSSKLPPSPPESHKPQPNPKPTGPSITEIQEELRKDFERQQALVQEQLASLAQRERESAATTGLDELLPSLIIEKGKAHEEKEKAKMLPADLDAWARQLERKEKELASISSYYKEQLEILEKKNFDIYKESAEQYNQSATKAEAHIRPRQVASVCTELQAKVLQCYRESPQQTLHCSSLAKQYMACVQQAKKSSLTNHG